MRSKTKIDWGTLLLAYTSLFALALMDNSRGPLYPFILQQFRVSHTEGSLFFSLASGCQVLMTLLGPLWLSRLGSHRSLQTLLLFQSAGYLLMGFAGQSAGSTSWTLLMVGASVFGISLGGLGIVQNSLVADASPEQLQRRAYSGLHANYALASLCAPFLVTALLWFGLPWFGCFLAISILPLILALATLFTKRPATSSHKKGKWTRLKLVHFHNATLLGLYTAAEVLISSRLVLYVVRDLHWPEGEAASLLSLFFLFLLSGRLFFSFYHLRYSSRRILMVSALLSIVFFMAGIVVHPIWLAVCGLSMSVFFPMCVARVPAEFPEGIDTVMTVVMAMAGLSLVLMHWGVGVLSDHFGLRNALFTGPCCLILIVFGLIFRGEKEV